MVSWIFLNRLRCARGLCTDRRPTSREEKALLAELSPAQVTADTFPGWEAVTGVLAEAPGNGAGLGGIR